MASFSHDKQQIRHNSKQTIEPNLLVENKACLLVKTIILIWINTMAR